MNCQDLVAMADRGPAEKETRACGWRCLEFSGVKRRGSNS